MKRLAPKMKKKTISFSSVESTCCDSLSFNCPHLVPFRSMSSQFLSNYIQFREGQQQQHQQRQQKYKSTKQSYNIMLKFQFSIYIQKMRAASVMRMEHGTVMRIMINAATLKMILPMAWIKHKML